MALYTDGVFAGMESIMEGDVEINNEVQVPAEETAEGISDAIDNEETAAEGSEVVEEAEAEEVKDQMIANNFNIMLNMYDVAKTRGIDSTFLALFDRDGGLSRMVNVRFPSCESMDAIGNPNSSYSQAFVAAMEADDGIFHKIWEWIKKVCVKVRDFLVRVWDWVASAFGSLTRKIGNLNKRINDGIKKKEAEDLKDAKTKVYKKDELNKAFAKYQGTIADLISGCGVAIKNGAGVIMTGITNASGARASMGGADKDTRKKKKDELKKTINELKDVVKKVDKEEVKSEQALDSTGMKALLKTASTCVEQVARNKQEIQTAKMTTDQARQAAERASQMSTGRSLTHAEVKPYQDAASDMAKYGSIITSAVALGPKIANMACQIVAGHLSAFYVPANKQNASPESSDIKRNSINV